MKIYNWMFTMYGGRIRYETPMLWFISRLSGDLYDRRYERCPLYRFRRRTSRSFHNSLFLVAHFIMIIGGVLFGAAFAAMTFCFRPSASAGRALRTFWPAFTASRTSCHLHHGLKG